jgi:hypothetical protein
MITLHLLYVPCSAGRQCGAAELHSEVTGSMCRMLLPWFITAARHATSSTRRYQAVGWAWSAAAHPAAALWWRNPSSPAVAAAAACKFAVPPSIAGMPSQAPSLATSTPWHSAKHLCRYVKPSAPQTGLEACRPGPELLYCRASCWAHALHPSPLARARAAPAVVAPKDSVMNKRREQSCKSHACY